MKFDVTDIGTRRREIAVTVPAEAVTLEFGSAYNEIMGSIQLPGFRKGKVPRTVIQKRFGEQVASDVYERLMQSTMGELVKDEELPIVGQPEIEADKETLAAEKEFSFSMKVDLKPTITMPEYKGIEVEKPKVSINDDDVEKAIDNLRHQYGKEVELQDHGMEEKDFCMAELTINIDGQDEPEIQTDVRVAPSTDYIIGIQIEGLKDSFTGKKAGEKITLKASLPDNHPKESWRGKDVSIDVAINSVKTMELPELNDDFAADFGVDDVDELKEEVRENIEKERNLTAKRTALTSLQNALVEKTEVEASDNLIEKYGDMMVQNAAMNLVRSGLPPENISEHIEQMKAGAREDAVKQVTADILFEEIADKERIYASERDVQDTLNAEAARQGVTPEKLEEEMTNRGNMATFRDDLRRQKTLDFLLEKAVIKEVEPQEKE